MYFGARPALYIFHTVVKCTYLLSSVFVVWTCRHLLSVTLLAIKFYVVVLFDLTKYVPSLARLCRGRLMPVSISRCILHSVWLRLGTLWLFKSCTTKTLSFQNSYEQNLWWYSTHDKHRARLFGKLVNFRHQNTRLLLRMVFCDFLSIVAICCMPCP